MDWDMPLQRLVESLQTLQMWSSANEAFGKLASLSIVTLGGTPAISTVPAPKRTVSHYVRPGESLYSLSKQYKLDVSDIVVANPNLQSPNNVRVGTRISIPQTRGLRMREDLAIAVIEPGDSLSKIAAKHNCSVEAIQDLNDLSSEVIHPGMRLRIPLNITPAIGGITQNVQAKTRPDLLLKNPRRITVQAGDHLTDISNRHKITIRRIQRFNNIASSVLHEGQELYIDPPPISRRDFNRTDKELSTANRFHGKRRTKRRLLLQKATLTKSIGRGTLAARLCAYDAGIAGHCNLFKENSKGKNVGDKAATTFFMTPVRSGFLSSNFGPRGGSFHYGLDLAAEEGVPISAAAGGVVTFSGWASGYGNLLEIEHGAGYITRYGHCSSLKYKTGQRVHRGQVVAAVGATGAATGEHLHFEIRRHGKALDPLTHVRP